MVTSASEPTQMVPFFGYSRQTFAGLIAAARTYSEIERCPRDTSDSIKGTAVSTPSMPQSHSHMLLWSFSDFVCGA